MNVPTGDQPFLHIHEGVLISLYVFFDCYVICGLFVGVLDLLYCAKVRAHAIYYVQKYEFISIINTFCSLFYIILSKNVRICNFARRKGTLVLSQIMGHLQKISKKITRRHSHPQTHSTPHPAETSRILYTPYRRHPCRPFGVRVSLLPSPPVFPHPYPYGSRCVHE